MAARDIIKGDIIEISFMLLPVYAKLPPDMQKFAARVYLVQPVIEVEDFAYREIIPEGSRKDFVEVWWEQRSNNRKGVVLVPPIDSPPSCLRELPRVKLIKRPK